MAGSLLLGLLTPYGAGHKASAEAAFDYSKVPKLLITELVPDTTNVSGSDGYEFIEVYNNSQETIHFNDYSIVYSYGSTRTAWPLTGESEGAAVDIPSRQAVVFWVMNSANQEVPTADFLANFGGGFGLEAGTNLFRIDSTIGGTTAGGMHNSNPRTLSIVDRHGNTVVSASYQNDDQTKPDKGIFYSYPTDGSTEMAMVTTGEMAAGLAPATPGAVEEALVPAYTYDEPGAQPADPEPTEPAPTGLHIDHTPVTEASLSADLKIGATVSGAAGEPAAKLFYKPASANDYAELAMTRSDGESTETGSVFEAAIPKEALTEAGLQYYIEATDGSGKLQTDVYNVTVSGSGQEDLSDRPPLLITELAPDTANVTGASADAYEFIEVYNNSTRTINLKDYKLIYRYTNQTPAKDVQWPTGDVPIPSGQAVALWIINGSNDALTAADFNANFGTSLTLGTDLFRISNDGMANGGQRSLVIQDARGQDLVAAHYETDAQTVANKGIFFRYPDSGSIEMAMISAGTEAATPGSVTVDQVPGKRVELPETSPNDPPVITHTPVTTASPEANLTISATVTDAALGASENEVLNVTLYYKSASQSLFSSIPMGAKPGGLYEGQIPKSALAESEIQYYIEATDGTNTVKTDLYPVTVQLGDFDPSKVPPLLVTELVPDSTNVGSADGYEFIEIYNNSNQAINLKNYKLYYRYTDSGPDADIVWPTDSEEMIIPSRQTFVFWVINSANGAKTADDFNAVYGTDLKENVNLFRIYSDGMANSSKRGVAIGTNTHVDISAAYYNGTIDSQTVANKGIVYKYPSNGSTEMIMLSAGTEAATPGTVSGDQVPAVPVSLPEDTTEPTIADTTGLQEISQSNDLHLSADASDDQSVKSVALYYKNDSASDYTKRYLYFDYDDQNYQYTIYAPDLIGHSSIQYYYVVSDGTNEVTSATHTIAITGGADRSPLRLNLKDGDFVNGTFLIKGTAESAGPDSLTLKVDGQDVSSSTYHALERDATFAFEANSVNYYFKNGVTIGQEILYTFQDPINSYTTLSVPIAAERLQSGDNVISIRAGTKASPFDDRKEENKDDFTVRNVRLVLSDGTQVYDSAYSDPAAEIKMGDSSGRLEAVDFRFKLPDGLLKSKAYSWNTASAGDGEHTITAAGSGGSKVQAKVYVDNTAPSIAASVEDGKTYRGPFELKATIADALSGVKSTEATLDGKSVELPYATSSSKLGGGTHVLVIAATDNVGNKAEKTISFSVPNENPLPPELVAPANDSSGVDANGKLTVKVTDPSGDPMKVSFYKGYKYDAAHRAGIAGYRNASDVEPPKTIAAAGEQALTEEEWAKLAAEDGNYLTEDSKEKFPYHRFDVELDKSVQATDEVVIDWKGKSLEGRKVSLYAWSPSESKYVQLDSKIAGAEPFALSASVEAGEYAPDGKIHVLVQDERPVSEDPYDFSFVWMSDTQYYSESYPYIYSGNTQWIVDNKDKMNIKYVLHTGDVVDDWDQEYQWIEADKDMKTLEAAGIPYGVLAGNHDVDHQYSDYSQFYKYFGADRFANVPTYGGTYLNNRGHYDLISAGGVDFIAIYMGWDIRDQDIEWINEVLKQYPDRKAILNFHEYLLVSANRAPISDVIYEKVVVPNKNVFMVLCGHYHDAEDKVDMIDDDGDGVPDREVHQILADYQGAEKGGLGYIRLLQFDTANNKVHVKTYSPYLDDYNYYDPKEYPGKDEFDIHTDLKAMDKQVATDYFGVRVYSSTAIGSQSEAASGSAASVSWTGLQAGAYYQWYATAEDANSGFTRSDIWGFTAGEGSGASDTAAPAWGTGAKLTASAKSSSAITLKWPAAKDDTAVSAYRIYKNGQLAATVSGSVLSYRATGLASSTAYRFKVEAGDAAGNWTTDGPEATFRTNAKSEPGDANAGTPDSSGSNGTTEPTAPTVPVTPAEPTEPTEPPVPAGELPFKDVDGKADWAKEAIGALYRLGIVQGTSQTTFEPKKNITRADFMALLVRLLDLRADFDSNFSDVSPSDYYYDAIGVVRRLGIATGTGGNRFNPREEITRQDMMVLLARALEVTGKLKLSGTASDVSGYRDHSAIASYAADAVAAMEGAGIVEGDGTALRPTGKATRAETAQIVYRIYGMLNPQ